VNVDQDYSQRPGYSPDFLGTRALSIPLPRAGRNVLTFTDRGRRTSELRYWNYSVVMHRGRQLALLSAVNVDADRRPNSARDGDRWYEDTRIDADNQLGQEFYGQQRDFEADRSQNPFDRGHLTRRLDAQWGRTAAQAKRNGDDSFHWTNCSPQHWRFNQGSKRWLGLEDYVIDRFSAPDRKASVFNGPVFDAPLSTIGNDGRPTLNLRGSRHADPTFGGVAIPKIFFKVVACRRDAGLAAAAFLMSQEDFLLDVDRLRGLEAEARRRRLEVLTDAEARLYQVSVADVERLTGIDFGALATADTLALEAIGERRPRPIQEFSDIRLGRSLLGLRGAGRPAQANGRRHAVANA
jgi:endonuclease G